MIQGSIQTAVAPPPVGLKDAGHIILRCSACDAQLVDIWVQLPNSGQKWKARATCPYCFDKSYVSEFEGGFAQGGISVPNPNDPENPIEKTRVVDIGSEGDVILFFVRDMSNGHPAR